MIVNRTHRNMVNAGLFQLNWFSCVLVGGSFALSTTAILLVLHFYLISRVLNEWLLMAGFSVTGYSIDTLIMHTGLIQFHSATGIDIPYVSVSLAPLWLMMLWVSFSTCLNHSLAYLQPRKGMTVLLVVLIIPINYYLGAKLTGATLNHPIIIPLAAITLYWAVLLPTGLLLMRHYVREKPCTIT